MRLPRKKPRNLLASVIYRLKPLFPLDFWLDLAKISERVAFEKAGEAGEHVWGANPFLHKHIKPDDRVLEIGCSSGRVLSEIKARERVGVDTDAAAIERGKKEHPDLTLIHGDGRDTRNGYDVLILSHVLEHIDQPGAFLSSLQFDRIYVEVPDFDVDPLNAVRLKRNRAYNYTDEDHVAEFGRDELLNLFDSAGLKVIDSEYRWGAQRYWVTR